MNYQTDSNFSQYYVNLSQVIYPLIYFFYFQAIHGSTIWRPNSLHCDISHFSRGKVSYFLILFNSLLLNFPGFSPTLLTSEIVVEALQASSVQNSKFQQWKWQLQQLDGCAMHSVINFFPVGTGFASGSTALSDSACASITGPLLRYQLGRTFMSHWTCILPLPPSPIINLIIITLFINKTQSQRLI